MNRKSFILGKIFGIPVGVDLSWFLIIIMLTWSFAVGYYPQGFKNWSTTEYWVMGGITSILLFVSVLIHELGHSYIALRYGIPVKGINLFIFGGISTISEEPKNASSEFWITIAGPIISFLLAGLFGLLSLLFSRIAPVLALTQYLAYINIFMGIFNLIPGYPLDGGGVLMAIIWAVTHNRQRAILIAANLGRVIAYLMILYGVYQMFISGLFNGIWISFIGWFLLDASGSQVQQEKLKNSLEKHSTSEAMNHSYTAIESDTTLQFLVDHHILRTNQRSFIVEEGDFVVGLLTIHQFSEIPKENWASTTVRQAMLPIDQMKQISPETNLWAAFEQMDRNGVNQIPVMVERRIVGVLTREDIITFLRNSQQNRKN
jgi:Zn-dependent protease/CBS domain-containing protein